MNENNPVYGFVLKGLLTDQNLDSTPRIKKKKFSNEAYQEIVTKLCINELDDEIVKQAQKMAVVYAGISAFENSVRKFITDILSEEFKDEWCETKVSNNIKNRAKTRREEETKIKWHASRGAAPIYYVDFGDLFLIIKNNWIQFEPFLNSQEWTEIILKTIERSRNVVMHSGDLENHDIERIGSQIRDWIKQVGG